MYINLKTSQCIGKLYKVVKKRYDLDQQFFVAFAIHERDELYKPFILKSICNDSLGLHTTIGMALHQELSEGEITKALLDVLESVYGDGLRYKEVSILNWWTI